jgi:hypothetical protein
LHQRRSHRPWPRRDEAGAASVAVAYTLAGFEHAARELDRGALPDPRAIISSTFGMDEFPRVIDELRGPNDYSKVHLDPWA